MQELSISFGKYIMQCAVMYGLARAKIIDLQRALLKTDLTLICCLYIFSIKLMEDANLDGGQNLTKMIDELISSCKHVSMNYESVQFQNMTFQKYTEGCVA